MAKNKSKLLVITLILLFLIGIATVILFLRTTKYGNSKDQLNYLFNDTNNANILHIKDSDSLLSDNNSIYHIDKTKPTTTTTTHSLNTVITSSESPPTASTTIDSKPIVLDENVCLSKIDNLSKNKCPQK